MFIALVCWLHNFGDSNPNGHIPALVLHLQSDGSSISTGISLIGFMNVVVLLRKLIDMGAVQTRVRWMDVFDVERRSI